MPRINIRVVEAELKELLAQRQKRNITDSHRLPSAVLIPIYKDGGQYHIIFIKRTETVKTHKGQIAFPGGMQDKEDKTLLDTALRESKEEIGLRKEDVKILGELDDELTMSSDFIVTPFAALIPWPYQFTLNKAEVACLRIFSITTLLDKNCLKPHTEILNGKNVDYLTYHCQGDLIWGATARILNKLLDMIATIIR